MYVCVLVSESGVCLCVCVCVSSLNDDCTRLLVGHARGQLTVVCVSVCVSVCLV